MVITIPAFETLEEVNRYTNFSFKPSLGAVATTLSAV